MMGSRISAILSEIPALPLASYGRRLLNDKVRWSVQFNVRDIFGADDLIAVTAQPNGAVASARIPQPNKWTVSNSFDF